MAIGQLERALSRMEAAQGKLRQRPATLFDNGGKTAALERDFQALEARYNSLREAMVTALGQIDSLIASGGE